MEPRELAPREGARADEFKDVRIDGRPQCFEEVERRAVPVRDVAMGPTETGIQSDREQRESALELCERVEVVQDRSDRCCRVSR